jgi:IS30 family transposase
VFMATYSHLTPDERDILANFRARGYSLRKIARLLKRHPSSLSRELRRNCAPIYKGAYLSSKAHQRAVARKSSACRRKRLKAAAVRKYVATKLSDRWSPELIAGRLRHDLPGHTISHEAIYQWVYLEARHLIPVLPKSHRRRKRRGYVRYKHTKALLPNRTPISARPRAVASRRVPGHWEVDTAGNHQTRRALLVIHERKSRLTKLRFLTRRGPALVQRHLIQALTPLPRRLRRSLTYDNGTENRYHQAVNLRLGTRSYFCAPYHSWEKGSVENTIGILRLRIPKSLNLDSLSHAELRLLEHWINTRPKKCLGYKTPAEVFKRWLAKR